MLKFSSTVHEIGQLRTGTHNVEVTMNGGVLTVYFDGAQVLQQKVTLPSTVKLAFTGATGGLTDAHTIRDAAIATGQPAAARSSSCAASYYPLLLPGGQRLHKPPLLPGRLGTVRLADGSFQVTYDGWPLFRYSGDRSPGNASGVSAYWQVVQPAF
ncbi:MAG TPA: hypothetical protein VF482_06730 [Trebonia sp.]